jgi:hypothetical protein
MATTEGSTRQDLAEIAALVDANLVGQAQERLTALVRHLPRQSLELLSPELRGLVERFQKQRRRDLAALLDLALARPTTAVTAVRARPITATPTMASDPEADRVERYALRLADLRDRHIFQWTTFYRETVGYVFRDLHVALANAGALDEPLEAVSAAFTQHSREIFERGYLFVTAGGLPDEIATVKSLNGLQRFLYLIINLYLESRESVRGPRAARLTWDITSCLLLGVLSGYGRVSLGSRSGWDLLLEQRRGWVPALGFMTGRSVASLLAEAPGDRNLATTYAAIVPTLLALDQFSNRPRTSAPLLPRLSRIPPGSAGRLDITLGPVEPGGGRDLTLSCFFEQVVHDPWTLHEAVGLRATAIVGTFSGDAKRLVDSELADVAIEAGEIECDSGRADGLGALVLAKIDLATRAGEIAPRSQPITRNFAREFPLDDPDTRKMYMVERQSVKQLLQQFEQGTGIHLWCSVRRSGKTTAASNMADMSGQSIVVYQTMDHQPHQQELNIFARRVEEAT